jgi:hypothetical protein
MSVRTMTPHATLRHTRYMADLKALAAPEHVQQRRIYIGLVYALDSRFMGRWISDAYSSWHQSQSTKATTKDTPHA